MEENRFSLLKCSLLLTGDTFDTYNSMKNALFSTLNTSMYRPIALLHGSGLVLRTASSAILQSLQKHDHFQHSFHFLQMDFPLLSSTCCSAQQASISANNPFIGRTTPQPHDSGKYMRMSSFSILQYLFKHAYFHLFLWTYLFFADFFNFCYAFILSRGPQNERIWKNKLVFCSGEKVVLSERVKTTRVTCIAHLYGRFLNNPDSNFVHNGAICLLASCRVPLVGLKGFLSLRRVLHVSKHNDIVYTKYM